jgi:hypothetical protein
LFIGLKFCAHLLILPWIYMSLVWFVQLVIEPNDSTK